MATDVISLVLGLESPNLGWSMNFVIKLDLYWLIYSTQHSAFLYREMQSGQQRPLYGVVTVRRIC